MSKAARSFIVCIGVGIAIAAGPARADEADANKRAAMSWEEGRRHFKIGEYAAAAAAFERAASYAPHPTTLLDAEEAWERAGDPARAAEDCDRVLAFAQLPDKLRADARARLAVLGKKIATVDLKGPSTRAVKVDDGPQSAPLPVRRRLLAGHHTIVVIDLSSATTVEERAVDLVTGQTMEIDLTPATKVEEPAAAGPPPPAAPTPLPPPPPPPPPRQPTVEKGIEPPGVLPIIAWGVSAVSTAVAIGFGATTVDDKREYDRNPTPETRDAFHRDKAITNVAWGVAATSLVVGAALWLFWPSSGTRSANSSSTAGVVRF